ncbi:MAG: hypothetical protein FWG55_02560 [Candidatus Bathyarchaeota archaeon]|nr:hypothetical protein [Candidatus Termiticorpusculum sp.]
MAQSKACSPSCSSFRCGKNAAWFRRDGVWCKDGDEYCTVVKCTYAMCSKRRLLSQGICGETVKRKTVERQPDEFFEDDDPKLNAMHLKGKALRKLSRHEDDDDF